MDYPTHYLVNIEGVNTFGELIVSENKLHLNDYNNINDDLIQVGGSTPYLPTECKKTCIGGTYAYHIQQFQKGSQALSRLRVVPAFKAFDFQSQTANPYYWYSTQDLGPFANPTHQIGPFTSGPNGNVTVLSPAGSPLVGLVYGYQKTLGVWNGQSDIETDGNQIIGTEFCGNASYSLNSTINLMNAVADFSQPGGLPDLPPLSCVPANTGGSGNPLPDNPGPNWNLLDSSNYVSFSYCIQNGQIVPCPKKPTIHPSAFDPNIISAISIQDLNNPIADPIVIDVSSLYRTNGTFRGFNITLNPSLYSFGFMFKESGYWTKIGELTTTTTISITQADLVDLNVFPTPIVDNKFNIKAEAQASVKFNYELRDFTGNLVLSRKFVVHKDHVKLKKINGNIPQGLLLHRFIFEDGSVKTIQTIKN